MFGGLLGFTKLDEGILKSSIMAENSDAFKVWIALLASCGHDGVAKVSAIFLSSVCHLSLETVEVSLNILESPDKHSRSLEEEGKRIKRVDGGYFVINYAKYREFTYSQSPEAIRKREYRKKQKERDIVGQPGTSPGHSASASSSASKDKNHKVSLPEWVPEEEFNEYKKMRKLIRKPMTDRAESLAIRKLERLKNDGENPKQVLEQSIMHSWIGLFPLKDHEQDNSRKGAIEREDEIIRLWVEEKDEEYRSCAEEILEKRKARQKVEAL